MPVFLRIKKNVLLLVILILLQLFLISLQIPLGEENNYFEKAVFFLFAPVKHGAVAFYDGVGKMMDGVFNLLSIKKENRSLSREMDFLRQENLILKKLIARDRTEEEIRSLLLTVRESIMMARVIGLDYGNFFKSLVINLGSSHGITKDMVVLDKFGQLVGRVCGPVSLFEARIQLITDIDSGIAVYAGESEVAGILSGDGHGRCVVKHILATDEKIRVGQAVYTSGFDGIYPPGVPVGEIQSVESNVTLFKDVLVLPYFNFRRLDRVAVIKLDQDIFF
jgi:rod shape-determining protein MreC